MMPNAECQNDNYENYSINTYSYLCINMEHKPPQFINRTRDILTEWFRRYGPKPPPVVESDLPAGAPLYAPGGYYPGRFDPPKPACECGAHITAFPDVHSFWCPAYTDNGAL